MPPEVDDFGVENEEIVQTQLYALALDDDKLENSGFSNTFKDLPLQHVNLFLPFFISDLSVNDVDFFKESLKPELFEKFKECFLYPDKDQKIMTLFNFFVKSLRKSKFARAFANWIQKFGKDEEMKQLFWMDMVDRGAFAVYKYHILGIGNEYNPGDNVDKIASVLYMDEIIEFLRNDGDSDYNDLANEIAALNAYNRQHARWKVRNLFIIRMITMKSQKKQPKFWFNEFLLALDCHPNTRPLAKRLEPNFKQINEKYQVYLRSLVVPFHMNDELVDENYIPTEFRKQSQFGEHPPDCDRVRVDSYNLYRYQEELVGKAKQGVNTIICAPTGSGKTIVAIDIIVNHLRNNCFASQPARVVMFVPTIPLVEQQYLRIKEKIGREWHVTKMSGAEKLYKKDEYDDQTNRILIGDVCVMTPQIFVNMLLTPIKKHKIYIQDFTLMVFDECHHCDERHPYNIVMENVMKQEYKPQIVGLTATVGVGKSRGQKELDTQSCTEHIIGLCARLNATTISSVREPKNIEELKQRVSDPIDEFYSLRPESVDKFAHELALCMDRIYIDMEQFLDEIKRGSIDIAKRVNLPLEQVAVMKNGTCKTSFHFSNGLAVLNDLIRNRVTSKKLQQEKEFVLKCIILLQKFYFALKLNELFPAKSAWNYLQEELMEFKLKEYDENCFLNKEMKELLWNVIKRVSGVVQDCGKYIPSSERKPILDKLFEIIKNQYIIDPDSRIIIFVTLRKAAKSLKDYLGNHEEIIRTFGKHKVGYIASTNQARSVYGQNKQEQMEYLKKFSNGQINILIATSVAEEGLDVAECNLVIKYNSVGSEKSFIQRKGRARHMDSRSILLALDYDTEQREYLNVMKAYMMNICVNHLQSLHETRMKEMIVDAQDKYRAKRIEEERRINEMAKRLGTRYRLNCSNCGVEICLSSSLRVLNNQQYIVCHNECWKDTSVRSKNSAKTRRAMDSALGYFCGEWLCKCGAVRGEVINYGDVFLPTVSKDAFKLYEMNGSPKEMSKTVTWKFITENIFVVASITIDDIREMAGSLNQYEKVYKAATQNELENLAEMAKTDHRTHQPKLYLD